MTYQKHGLETWFLMKKAVSLYYNFYTISRNPIAFNDTCMNILKQNALIFTDLVSINLKHTHQHLVWTMFTAI